MVHHILTVPQIRASEVCAFRTVPSLNLMEAAGSACVCDIKEILILHRFSRILIFCGTGNNGGDGLVIARKLAENPPTGLEEIQVILCKEEGGHFSDECAKNLERWEALLPKTIHTSTVFLDDSCHEVIRPNDLVVDAIFGIGLNKKPMGIHAFAIRKINESDAFVVAIDIPSGLFADQHTPSENDIIIANVTLSIQFWKIVFMLPEAQPFYGEVRILDIHPGFKAIGDKAHEWEYLLSENLCQLLHSENPHAHKGTFGHGLLIAGSDKMPGAALLSATAAMRGGIGKLTVHTTSRALQALPIVLPEAILDPEEEQEHFSDIRWEKLNGDINAIAVGPGLGRHPKTVNAIKNLLDEVRSPLIIDADALNMLADNKTWLAYLPAHSILTPHFREFDRLAGSSSDDFERLAKARDFAQRYNCILILKGHHTVICSPDGYTAFNSTGNEGMATAGSGDVLTGLLLALLAQGYNPLETALLAVHIHGLAGDLYACDNAPQSLIATDLPKYFGAAFQHIINFKTNNI